VTSEIVQVSQSKARSIFDNLESLSTFATSYALAGNLTWPFVVIPDFQVHAMVSSQITGADTVGLYPLVSNQNREMWEVYSQYTYYGWMAESHRYDSDVNPTLYVDPAKNSSRDPMKASLLWNATSIEPYIWHFDNGENGARLPAKEAATYAPQWQVAPAYEYDPLTNTDMLSHPVFQSPIKAMLEKDKAVLTDVTDASFLWTQYDDGRFPVDERVEPHSYLLQPVYSNMEVDRTTVAVLSAFLRWGQFFDRALPEYETGILLVLHGTCGRKFSYILNGHKASFLGDGDLHNPDFDKVYHDFEIVPGTTENVTANTGYCLYKVRIYPSDEWTQRYFTNTPYYYALAVIACFLVTTLVFVIYDRLVQRR
jgi:hypothetical protein